MKSTSLYLLLLALLLPLAARSQGIGIGTATPNSSAALDVTSTTKGLLLPRMTTAQRVAIPAPAAGLLVFQTDNAPGVYYYNGTTWLNLTTGVAAPNFNQGVVTTLAGTVSGYADGTGTAALFSGPNGIVYDGNGNLYVSEQYNNRIRKIVVATGVVTTIAGGGPYGAVDGTGTAAQFSSPAGLAYDGSGVLYVADFGNHRIRKVVVATGVVTTLAGSTMGFADATGTAARFDRPSGVAYDGSGNLLVADQNNNRLRRVVVATGAVSTLAGSTMGFADGTGAAALFNTPAAITYDGNGNFYVADKNNNRIRKFVAATGAVSTLAGGTFGQADGTGTLAQFSSPVGITCDASGNLFVVDRESHRIRKVVVATGAVTTLAGSTMGTADGTGSAAQFRYPADVACDGSGNVYVTDLSNHLIRVIR